jgi:kynureninase
VKVGADPADTLAERLAAAVNDRTAAVLCSSVLFGNAHIVPGMGALCAACRRVGAELLVDAYHHLNVVPFSLERLGLGGAFVAGGGTSTASSARATASCACRPGATRCGRC